MPVGAWLGGWWLAAGGLAGWVDSWRPELEQAHIVSRYRADQLGRGQGKLMAAATQKPSQAGAVAAPDNPFAAFHIDSHAPLEAQSARQRCPGCSKTRKFFCYDCLKPIGEMGSHPHVQLPCEIHVVKHPQERNSKSTGVHAPVLSDAQLFSYSDDEPLPDYNPASTVLLFPSPTSRSLQEMGSELKDVKTAVIVDCTWSQVVISSSVAFWIPN